MTAHQPTVKSDQALIPLKNSNKMAIVDKESLPIVLKYKWRLDCNGYVTTGSYNNGTYLTMHRLLLSCPPEMFPDHIDRNPLNNSLSNLRPATRSQNAANSKIRKDSKTKLRGVSFYSRDGTYAAHIRINGKTKYLGYFESPTAAAIAYDSAAYKLFGEFASLNFGSNAPPPCAGLKIYDLTPTPSRRTHPPLHAPDRT